MTDAFQTESVSNVWICVKLWKPHKYTLRQQIFTELVKIGKHLWIHEIVSHGQFFSYTECTVPSFKGNLPGTLSPLPRTEQDMGGNRRPLDISSMSEKQININYLSFGIMLVNQGHDWRHVARTNNEKSWLKTDQWDKFDKRKKDKCL